MSLSSKIKDHKYYNKRSQEIIKELVRLEQQNALGSFYHKQLCKEFHRNDDIDYRLTKDLRMRGRLN